MDKANLNVEQSEDERTTAIGLARYAYEYLDAAILVDQHHGAQPGHEFISPIPAYYLASHAIELTLKAYLRHRGVSARQLRSRRYYGHDLRACYRKAKELGLRDIFKMHADDLRALLLLIQLNENQELRYIRTGAKRFPSWAIVEPLAVRLHQAVAPHVGYNRTFTRAYGKHGATAADGAIAGEPERLAASAASLAPPS